jgi:hypothetical protein
MREERRWRCIYRPSDAELWFKSQLRSIKRHDPIGFAALQFEKQMELAEQGIYIQANDDQLERNLQP